MLFKLKVTTDPLGQYNVYAVEKEQYCVAVKLGLRV